MNRVKAEDTWARVSAKRYGSRLDGNEARIEALCISPSSSSSLSLSFALSLRASLYGSLHNRMNSHCIIVASFVPFDYLGTIQSCARTS